MISIIICSRSAELAQSYRDNIQATIGTDYEFVVVDNHDNHHTIFTAYNEGVSRAKGDILCFMHDDVSMHTESWGRKVEQHMQDTELGILGIIGSHVVPSKGDWRVGFPQYHVMSFIQRVPTYGQHPTYFTQLNHVGFKKVQSSKFKVQSSNITEVAIVDGVWFCIRRELFSEGLLHFDDDSFKGFHLYDSDISMQAGSLGKKIAVCDDIILEHFSEGAFNSSFVDSLALFHKKWDSHLPVIRNVDANANVDVDKVLEGLEEKADSELSQRIQRDAEILRIRQYWKDIAEGKEAEPLTESQKSIISKAAFLYVKTAVKFCPDDQRVGKLMGSYLADPMMQHKMLLIWKYFLYRKLNIKPRKSNNTI